MQKPTLSEKLSEIYRHEEEAKTKDLAIKLHLPYLDLFGLPVDVEALEIVPEEKAEEANLIPLKRQGKHIEIAAVDPSNAKTKTLSVRTSKKGLCLFYHLNITV